MFFVNYPSPYKFYSESITLTIFSKPVLFTNQWFLEEDWKTTTDSIVCSSHTWPKSFINYSVVHTYSVNLQNINGINRFKNIWIISKHIHKNINRLILYITLYFPQRWLQKINVNGFLFAASVDYVQTIGGMKEKRKFVILITMFEPSPLS